MPAHPKANPTGHHVPAHRRRAALVRLESAPIEAVEPPPPPPDLPPEAVEVWTAVWEAGGSAYHLATDGWVIARYAEMTVRRRQLLKIIESEGWVTIGSAGQPASHPAARLLSDVEQKLQSLEDRLGLSPESRIRLGIAAVDQKSKLRRFLDEET